MKLKPFFGYFGGKFRISPQYPAPIHSTLIEPFAGAAGYALRHYTKQVVLAEKDPVVAAAWRYLIEEAGEEDVLALPLLPDAETTVDDLPGLSEGARALICLNLSAGDAGIRTRLSNFARDWRPPWKHRAYKDPETGYKRVAKDGEPWEWHDGYENFWGEKRRARIARQIVAIEHWHIVEGDYTLAPDIQATWFIDPPYERAGKAYRYHDIDYVALGQWCQERQGQVIVCEAEGASWLPFEPFGSFKSNPGKRRSGKTSEVIYYRK